MESGKSRDEIADTLFKYATDPALEAVAPRALAMLYPGEDQAKKKEILRAVLRISRNRDAHSKSAAVSTLIALADQDQDVVSRGEIIDGFIVLSEVEDDYYLQRIAKNALKKIIRNDLKTDMSALEGLYTANHAKFISIQGTASAHSKVNLDTIFEKPGGAPDEIEQLMQQYGPGGAYLMYHLQGDLPQPARELRARMEEVLENTKMNPLAFRWVPDDTFPPEFMLGYFESAGFASEHAYEPYAQNVVRLSDETAKREALLKIDELLKNARDIDRTGLMKARGILASNLTGDDEKMRVLDDMLPMLQSSDKWRNEIARTICLIGRSLNGDKMKKRILDRLRTELLKKWSDSLNLSVQLNIDECMLQVYGMIGQTLNDPADALKMSPNQEKVFRDKGRHTQFASARIQSDGLIVSALKIDREKQAFLERLVPLQTRQIPSNFDIRIAALEAYGVNGSSLKKESDKEDALAEVQKAFTDFDERVQGTAVLASAVIAKSMKSATTKEALVKTLLKKTRQAIDNEDENPTPNLQIRLSQALGLLAGEISDTALVDSVLALLEELCKNGCRTNFGQIDEEAFESYGSLGQMLTDEGKKLRMVRFLEKHLEGSGAKKAIAAYVKIGTSLTDSNEKLPLLAKLTDLFKSKHTEIAFPAMDGYTQLMGNILQPYRAQLASVYQANHARFTSSTGTNITEVKKSGFAVRVNAAKNVLAGIVNGEVVIEQPLLGKLSKGELTALKMVTNADTIRDLIDLMFFTS